MDRPPPAKQGKLKQRAVAALIGFSPLRFHKPYEEVIALREAGWEWKDIAHDLGLHGNKRSSLEVRAMYRKYRKDKHVKDTSWKEFRDAIERRYLPRLGQKTRKWITNSLDSFEKVIKPKHMAEVTKAAMDEFVAWRLTQPGRMGRDTTRETTVNWYLRHLCSAFGKAFDWNMMAVRMTVDELKTKKHRPTYIDSDNFEALYNACQYMKQPKRMPYTACEWWQGLLTTAYLTGWRIGELVALRRSDVDLEAGTILTRAEDNKASYDEVTHLHPVVVEHLRKLAAITKQQFQWPFHHRKLYEHFAKLQEHAGLTAPEGHRYYGFHDLRRGFATLNATNMAPTVLQQAMRHQSFKTTQRYINMAEHENKTAVQVFVPDILKKKQA